MTQGVTSPLREKILPSGTAKTAASVGSVRKKYGKITLAGTISARATGIHSCYTKLFLHVQQAFTVVIQNAPKQSNTKYVLLA